MTEDLCDPPMLIHLVLRLGGLIPELLTRRSAPDLTAQRPRDSQPSYKMTRSTSALLPQMMVAHRGIRGASLVTQIKNPPAVQETRVQSLGGKDPLVKGMPTHSTILGIPSWLRQ